LLFQKRTRVITLLGYTEVENKINGYEYLGTFLMTELGVPLGPADFVGDSHFGLWWLK
jgi:hypothetical protein